MGFTKWQPKCVMGYMSVLEYVFLKYIIFDASSRARCKTGGKKVLESRLGGLLLAIGHRHDQPSCIGPERRRLATSQQAPPNISFLARERRMFISREDARDADLTKYYLRLVIQLQRSF